MWCRVFLKCRLAVERAEGTRAEKLKSLGVATDAGKVRNGAERKMMESDLQGRE